MQNFLWRLAGIVLGIVGGGVLAALTGDLWARIFHISNFEGGRGYFVAFIILPIFIIVGAILGAIMITQGWRFNLSVLGILALLTGGLVYMINLPYQTETIGNFELQTYESESYGDQYGLRYQGKRVDVEELAGRNERNRRVAAFVQITPTVTADTDSSQRFIVIVGPPHETRAVYLVGEKDGAAFASYLCDTDVDAVDAIDQQPAINLTDNIDSRRRNIYLHRKEITGSRWFLLGDGCVFDLQTATAYPFTTRQARDSADPSLDKMHLPIALSPDRRSLVRLVTINQFDAQTDQHVGYSLHLLVNNFVEDSSELIAIDPQRMRVNRQLAQVEAADDIDQQWLDHHFEWQKDKDGNDRLVERSQFTPWALRGWLTGYDPDLEFRLVYAKPELIDTLEEFLIAQFEAKRINREHSDENGSIYTYIQLQIDGKELTLSFRSDDYSPSQISLWQSAPDLRDGEWLKEIAQAVNQKIQNGTYDDLFIFEPFF